MKDVLQKKVVANDAHVEKNMIANFVEHILRERHTDKRQIL